MIKSMTGFGRAEFSDEKRKITAEVKSVNHRYLDVNIKMTKKISFFETSVRSLLKEYMQRGKVDLYITYEDFTEDNVSLKYNKEMARSYLKYLNEMGNEFGLENDVRVSVLSRYPEVFTLEEQEVDEEELWKDLEGVVRRACEAFVESRLKEGENLKKDLIMKLESMLKYVDEIEKRAPAIIEEYRTRMFDRVSDMLADASIDESRILTEVTLYADRVCVDEEIVRLKSHIKGTEDTLNEGGSVGRKLDFIAQEMNREANTILSKSTDLSTSNVAIDLKTDIEKVREQIQNVE
ncbi:MAG: YicC family protein [Lachnospiraceae bacterium]|nr:YicC family protein [Lachnospiraceae bacterium]